MRLPHLSRLAPTVLLLAAGLPLGAAVFYWDANGTAAGTGGTGFWSPSATYPNFRADSPTGTITTWPNANPNEDELIFGGTAGTVSVSMHYPVYANRITFTTTGYVLDNSDDALSLLTFSGTAPTITVNSGLTVTSHANITGTAVTLAGGGTFRLGAANRIADTMALSITGGSTFALNGNNETLGTITLVNGSITGNGTLQTTGVFELQSGTVSAVLGGTGALTKTGTGTVTLSANNTFTGGTTIQGGILALSGNNRLANSGAVTIAGGTLALGANNDTVGAVTLTSGSITGTGTLTSNTGFTVHSGSIVARLGGNVGLTKLSAGTVTISGTTNYSGATSVQAGSLINFGTMNGTAVTVASGATFGGSGTAAGTVTVNGTLAPAGVFGPIGTLTTGAETWNSGGRYSLDLGNATGTAGAGWDRLNLTGTLTIAATAGSPFTIDLNGLNAAGNLGIVQNFNPSNSYSWTILNATSVSGFAANKFALDTTDFALHNPFAGTFAITATGNSLNLVYTGVVIPEPRVYALLLGAGTLGLVSLRRWRRREVLRGESVAA